MAALTYRKAGVDIDEADRFIKRIKPMVRSTLRPEVLGGIGGFSGLVRPRLKGMRRPVLVSSTDGVGTKIMLADLLRRYDTIGIDLVAMNADDVVVAGAEPLFFLDYIACGRVRSPLLAEVMKGIVKGCRLAGCALIGGETAELPGLYGPGQWDLAGFCVGIVDEDKIIDGRRVRPGDAVIGLASSGLHSNGYSLARRVFTEREIKGEVGRRLLRPTRIYASVILKALRTVPIRAMAHITGGGFYDNIPRVLPEGLGARIERGSWPIPGIFREVRLRGAVGEREMFRTFNMGVGMVVVVERRSVPAAVRLFESLRCPAWRIGEIVAGRREVVLE
jgi:phosphoribosylformylglycinamidine cyclo-ligase